MSWGVWVSSWRVGHYIISLTTTICQQGQMCISVILSHCLPVIRIIEWPPPAIFISPPQTIVYHNMPHSQPPVHSVTIPTVFPLLWTSPPIRSLCLEWCHPLFGHVQCFQLWKKLSCSLTQTRARSVVHPVNHLHHPPLRSSEFHSSLIPNCCVSTDKNG